MARGGRAGDAGARGCDGGGGGGGGDSDRPGIDVRRAGCAAPPAAGAPAPAAAPAPPPDAASSARGGAPLWGGASAGTDRRGGGPRGARPGEDARGAAAGAAPPAHDTLRDPHPFPPPPPLPSHSPPQSPAALVWDAVRATSLPATWEGARQPGEGGGGTVQISRVLSYALARCDALASGNTSFKSVRERSTKSRSRRACITSPAAAASSVRKAPRA